MDPDRSTLIMPARPGSRRAQAARKLPGRRLAGRYLLGEAIGHGGMSTVHRARDEVLDREVAVKILLAALAEGDPAHVARFEREARAAAALHHPSVVKVYDTGRDQGTHFIVMEYVTGQSLDRLLAAGSPLEPEEATRIAGQVAAALAAAHDAGIVHRDIKPANVMLTDEGAVKVLDFGIARARQDPTLTQPTFAIGTAAYMSPERVLGQTGDGRSDIYSLGCLLYAMLVGRPPFLADSSLSVLHQQVHADPVAPSSMGAKIALPLEALVMRMLAKEPTARPQTAAEVAGRLATPVPAPAAADPRLRDRRRRPLAALALAGLVAVVVALAVSTSGSPSLAAHRSSRRPTGVGHAIVHASPAVTQATAPAPTAPAPAKTPPDHRVPPGHGGVPPGHEPGGPPGHKDKPPKPAKGPDGGKWKPGKGGDGGD
ncbi:MAG TPA: protein kinase [Solirubrobacteraceae bacterium]|jgi:serine/threonine-protein kinase